MALPPVSVPKNAASSLPTSARGGVCPARNRPVDPEPMMCSLWGSLPSEESLGGTPPYERVMRLRARVHNSEESLLCDSLSQTTL